MATRTNSRNQGSRCDGLLQHTCTFRLISAGCTLARIAAGQPSLTARQPALTARQPALTAGQPALTAGQPEFALGAAWLRGASVPWQHAELVHAKQMQRPRTDNFTRMRQCACHLLRKN